ncbi:MAG: J domain-containing protein [Actinobacteria bacterium]|nr:J domain-containing protein [Actinomycetota bacterium]
MKTYYELLGVGPKAAADQIKRAFRREIARYHPDKVQHLGPEFQEIAATRAAELTEAYRVLMNAGARHRYDEGLTEKQTPVANRPAQAAAPPPAPRAPEPAPAAAPFHAPPQDRRFRRERASTSDFVRKAVFAKLQDAVAAVSGGVAVSTVPGIDAVYSLKGKGGLFHKGDPPLRLLAKFVAYVDAAVIEQAWPSAVLMGRAGETVCVLLFGSGLVPARELSADVSDQRRRSRKAGPVLVPVDVRDWEALFPPEAPASVRAIIQRLRAGEA